MKNLSNFDKSKTFLRFYRKYNYFCTFELNNIMSNLINFKQ